MNKKLIWGIVIAVIVIGAVISFTRTNPNDPSITVHTPKETLVVDNKDFSVQYFWVSNYPTVAPYVYLWPNQDSKQKEPQFGAQLATRSTGETGDFNLRTVIKPGKYVIRVCDRSMIYKKWFIEKEVCGESEYFTVSSTTPVETSTSTSN